MVAGLITVLFSLSTIALTREDEQKRNTPGRFTYLCSGSSFCLGLIRYLGHEVALFGVIPPGAGNVTKSFGDTLWNVRALDMIGQIAVILGGVFVACWALSARYGKRQEFEEVRKTKWVSPVLYMVFVGLLFFIGLYCLFSSRNLIKLF